MFLKSLEFFDKPHITLKNPQFQLEKPSHQLNKVSIFLKLPSKGIEIIKKASIKSF
jgi:hypothetical protein